MLRISLQRCAQHDMPEVTEIIEVSLELGCW
jgi:hypothetical protein